MNRKLTGSLLLSTLLASMVPLSAQADDGLVCYSAIFETPIGSEPGTYTATQLGNQTKFTCGTSVQYTLQQLAQRGWDIVMVTPYLYSTTVPANPQTSRYISRNRFMIVMQKH